MMLGIAEGKFFHLHFWIELIKVVNKLEYNTVKIHKITRRIELRHDKSGQEQDGEKIPTRTECT